MRRPPASSRCTTSGAACSTVRCSRLASRCTGGGVAPGGGGVAALYGTGGGGVIAYGEMADDTRLAIATTAGGVLVGCGVGAAPVDPSDDVDATVGIVEDDWSLDGIK